MAKEGMKALYSLYYSQYRTMEPAEIIREIDRYFKVYKAKVEAGECDETSYYIDSDPFYIFDDLLSKKYYTSVETEDFQAMETPLKEAYESWCKTGKAVMKRGLSDLISCEGNKRDALEWLFVVIRTLRLPISYFDCLGLKEHQIPNANFVAGMNSRKIRWVLKDSYKPDLKFLAEKRYDIGDSVEVTFTSKDGKKYEMKAVIEKVFLGDYYCHGYIENYTEKIFDETEGKEVYAEQGIILKRIPGWYQVCIREKRITEDMAFLDCMLGNIDWPLPGEKWKAFNEARLRKAKVMKEEYILLRKNISYEKPKPEEADNDFEEPDEPLPFESEESDDINFQTNPSVDAARLLEEMEKDRKHHYRRHPKLREYLDDDTPKKEEDSAKKYFFTAEEEEAREKKIDELMHRFDDFLLTDISKSELRGYLRYLLSENEIALNYHFLIQSDSDRYGYEFTRVLVRLVNEIKRTNRKLVEFEERFFLNKSSSLSRVLHDDDIVFVKKAIPLDKYYANEDAGPGAREERDMYDTAWEEIAEKLNNHLVIMNVSKEIAEGRMKNLPSVYYRFFRHHIHLKNLSEEEIIERLLDRIQKEAGDLSDDFEQELRKYIYTVYQKADLKNQEFVDNLYDWMIALAYRNVGSRRIMFKESIPYYHKNDTFDYIYNEFEELVGLEDVKEVFRDIALFARNMKKGGELPYLHMFFYGNPGTGKTTVARRLAKLFASMGIIKNGKVFEVSSSDLIGQYVGSTGPKVQRVLKQAENAVLFIDEAYAITPSTDTNSDTYREECISTLIKAMERKNNPIIIFAGYPREMEELKKSNPGLASRVGYDIHFKDYDNNQLLEIFRKMCDHDEFGYDEKTLKAAERKIVALRYEENFGNARTVENIFNQAKTESLRRDVDSHFISEEDIVISDNLRSPETLQAELDSLVGIYNARKMIKEQVLSNKFCKEHGMAFPSSNNMIFVGNPGTGKTTTARLFSEMLFSIGVAKSPRFRMITAKDLFVPNVAEKMNEFITSVMGGVLFIDEIYMIEGTSVATGVVSVLLEILEERKEDITLILAGYEKQMEAFLGENSGLKSRFPITVHFEDFTEDELLEIFIRDCEKAKMKVDEAGTEKFRQVISAEKKKEDFGNGRTVRNLFEQAFRRHAVNFYENPEESEENVITACDIEELSHANEKAIKKMGFGN